MEEKIDFVGELDSMLKTIGLSRDPAVSELSVTGRDPVVKSPLRMGAAIGVPLLTAAIGSAQIWQLRTGRSQRLSLDLGQGLHRMTPLLGGGATLGGYFSSLGSLAGIDGMAPTFWDFYRTADGRWVIPIACYPRIRDALLCLLDCAHSREHITAAIARWNASSLEDAAAEQGVPLAIVRTREEFLAHPQGRAVLAEPVVAVERIGDGPPVPLPSGPRPLSSLRCLQFTHILAGTATGRALAEYGADVLHVCEPDSFEHEAVWNESAGGMRSARLDLHARGAGRDAFDRLLRDADVFVHNYRPGKAVRLGLTAQDCAAAAPGVIHCSVSAYGHTGPWRDRGGFDQHAQALTGISLREGGDGAPKLPPGRVFNDYIAAYLAASGIMAAVVRRARDGGSYSVRVSLAGVANWCWNLGSPDPALVDALDENALPAPPRWQVHRTPLGELRHIVPPARLSETPGSFDDPVLLPRGSSKPQWRSLPDG
ncbi:CoA transferase [Streptomyces boncukensis]|uniref:Carnitine dehydratase n=1 Tax=Streptomyces boncukensis TaxID=2711219 RepID=A0A6G4WPA2_9ACTN|nr:CoA transferase [Streptomyces boncukensis]NGO66843.1 carnitine dehydratase [Streptomyces boncukensis]